VLEGVPDHRDLILTQEEQASNKKMMICCSGSKSEKLVLDL
jgi:tetrachlorobenzoquinone reductase